MASHETRLIALAVARGLLEPEAAQGRTLAELLDQGLLQPDDLPFLEQSFGDLEAESGSHWSCDMTGLVPAEPGEDPTAAAPVGGGHPSDPLAGIRTSRSEGIFRATALERWGRFEDLQFLGEGGMGRIFRATDPRLRRMVALKLLRRDDPDLLRRFLQEAQLQARVDHPNVCRVYEVGEWRGQPYIVMQYIKGETLKDAVARLSREDLLNLMVQVCEGVHAAHRVGLVHRDLKPGNLMVEWPEDGGPRASVLDFGLARGPEGGSVTITGHVIGTVRFMSPEQARGDLDQLDRRSDVYSLGATLYALLAGHPPFDGEGLECMARIVKDDPVPLRRLVPELPADLETVVLTCLEKDPRRRYATARALGEDLQRVLDGEPIQARPATLAERAVRWARKRRALVTSVAAAGAAAAVFLGFAVRERLHARAQTAYARQFAQEAERIEALARYIRLQPARDLRPDQADLARRAAALAREVAGAGSLAEAPGAYALGRADLALEQPERAKAELERAWRLGYQAPEVAHALGRALASVYQAEVGKAYAIPDPDQRARRIAELDRTLRDPAAEWLTRGASASLEPPAYRQGLLAMMQGDPRRAADLARQAAAEAPWFYEAIRLEAEAAIAQARLLPDPRGAGSLLARAGALLGEAESRAPCDVDLLRLEMRQSQEAIALNWQTEADPLPLVRTQIDVARRWARLAPAAAPPLAWEARARAEEARWLAQRDRNPDPWLAEAAGEAGQALQRDGSDLDALTAQASVLRTRGLYRLNLGQDPAGDFREAARVADRGLRLDPSQIILMNIRSSALLVLIDALRTRGTYVRQEVLPYLEEARQMAQAHPDEAYYQGNLGGIAQAMARADLSSGVDPGADAQETIRAYEAALRGNPGHVGFLRGVLIGQSVLARAQAREGKDPREVVGEARRTFQDAQRASAPCATLAPLLLEALVAEGDWRRRHGADPSPVLTEAERLAPLLSEADEDAEQVVGIRLRYLALRLRCGPSGQSSSVRLEGRRLSQFLARHGSRDPVVWADLADFERASGDPGSAARALARAKALDPSWRAASR